MNLANLSGNDVTADSEGSLLDYAALSNHLIAFSLNGDGVEPASGALNVNGSTLIGDVEYGFHFTVGAGGVALEAYGDAFLRRNDSGLTHSEVLTFDFIHSGDVDNSGCGFRELVERVLIHGSFLHPFDFFPVGESLQRHGRPTG